MSEKAVRQKGKFKLILISLVRILLIVAFAGALLNHRWLVLFISVLALFITFLPSFLEKKIGIAIPADLEIMIILFVYGSLFFGEVRGFYAEFWWWGILLNLVAAIALGLVGLTILFVLYRDDKIDASPHMIAIFTFCFAFALGTIWEIFEFVTDTFLNFTLQQNSLKDTMLDLIANAVGAILVSLVGYYYIKRGKESIISRAIVNFIQKNPKFFRSNRTEEIIQKEINRLIKTGENKKLEFKSTLRTNIHTGAADKKIENAILKTITAMLNSEGGTLLVGITNTGEIIGLENDKFPDNDKLTLHFVNMLKRGIGNEWLPLINFDIIRINEKSILKIDCKPSQKPAFLNEEDEEVFYVRNGPSSVKVLGNALLEYVKERFYRGE